MNFNRPIPKHKLKYIFVEFESGKIDLFVGSAMEGCFHKDIKRLVDLRHNEASKVIGGGFIENRVLFGESHDFGRPNFGNPKIIEFMKENNLRLE
jgi:hypothetical protein